MNRDSIYTMLDLQEQIPAELVKKAFRRFARENHPDYYPGDNLREERFKKVNAAYQSWKLVQTTVEQIKQLRVRSRVAEYNTAQFKPWSFSCQA
ncbi:MAG: DnaJ domain-containing protein [Deltaproteobacteria bacterium]|nr:DnaJ domain-containing protein [Deltaproteobacteria bacterium]